MTQRFPFTLSDTMAPSFQPILDNDGCSIIITWNVSAQRYYINVYDGSGNLILSEALVESAQGITLANLIWKNGTVIATFTQSQPWRKVGQIVNWTISGCQPEAYNGTFECITLNTNSFSYPLSPNPGQAYSLGWAERRNDMIGPWFKTSTMYYRNGYFYVDP